MLAQLAIRSTHVVWLRTALCSTVVTLSSGAFAQSSPDAVPVASGASLSAAKEPPSSDMSKRGDPAPTKEQCIDSHRQAQQAQNDGKLVHARELARTCTSLVCPGLVISDCARWLNDLDQRIPSVVFEVRVDGEPNLSAMILADGRRVQEWTRGESLRLDPGEHQFRFELGQHQPIIQNLLLAEGMRFRIVSAEFKTSNQPPAAATGPALPVGTAAPGPVAPVAAPSTRTERPVPSIVYPALGLGGVGIVGFAVFGLLGESKHSNLESTCKPNCTDNDLQPMKTSYLLADISLGVGVASLVAAGAIYFGRPEKTVPATVGVVPLPGGGAAFAAYQF